MGVFKFIKIESHHCFAHKNFLSLNVETLVKPECNFFFQIMKTYKKIAYEFKNLNYEGTYYYVV